MKLIKRILTLLILTLTMSGCVYTSYTPRTYNPTTSRLSVLCTYQSMRYTSDCRIYFANRYDYIPPRVTYNSYTRYRILYPSRPAPRVRSSVTIRTNNRNRTVDVIKPRTSTQSTRQNRSSGATRTNRQSTNERTTRGSSTTRTNRGSSTTRTNRRGKS